MKELRDRLDLTRQQLSVATGRSVGYILKAEQYTFPRAPVALTQYYANALGIPISQLNQEYRDQQRLIRQSFHRFMVPRSTNTKQESFCNKWQLSAQPGAVGFSQDLFGASELISPNQYQVSKVLCIPASAVYFAERNGGSRKISAAITSAMSDLLDFCSSGKLYADMALGYDEAQQIHLDLERIDKELRSGNQYKLSA